jgi:hypothetical protein
MRRRHFRGDQSRLRPRPLRVPTLAHSLLGLTSRQVRRLRRAYERDGPVGLASKHRGRPSNRRPCPELRREALAIVHSQYEDFGPPLAHEKLTELHGLEFSVETLRHWMIDDGATSALMEFLLFSLLFACAAFAELIELSPGSRVQLDFLWSWVGLGVGNEAFSADRILVLGSRERPCGPSQHHFQHCDRHRAGGVLRGAVLVPRDAGCPYFEPQRRRGWTPGPRGNDGAPPFGFEMRVLTLLGLGIGLAACGRSARLPFHFALSGIARSPAPAAALSVLTASMGIYLSYRLNRPGSRHHRGPHPWDRAGLLAGCGKTPDRARCVAFR